MGWLVINWPCSPPVQIEQRVVHLIQLMGQFLSWLQNHKVIIPVADFIHLWICSKKHFIIERILAILWRDAAGDVVITYNYLPSIEVFTRRLHTEGANWVSWHLGLGTRYLTDAWHLWFIHWCVGMSMPLTWFSCVCFPIPWIHDKTPSKQCVEFFRWMYYKNFGYVRCTIQI